MSKNKTLIIVGAGASDEVGLPTGHGLRNKIAKLLDIRADEWGQALLSGDRVIYEVLRTMAQEQNISIGSYQEAAWKIRDSLTIEQSIDSFINKHKNNKLIEICGKLAIVRAILTAEKESNLYFKDSGYEANIDYTSIEDTWFTKFYQVLTEDCSNKEDLAERFDSLAMVIFNYDRCVEHFLFNSIQRNYGIDDPKEVAGLVGRIEIYHPYGKIGHLPWQKRDESIAFGAESGVDKLLSMSKQIRTFTEGTGPDSNDISSIKNHVKSSERVIFLGFAFHELNLKLLKPDSKDKANKSVAQCFATAYDISEHNCAVIKEELLKLKPMIHGNVYVEKDLSCVKLFQEFERSLSFT